VQQSSFIRAVFWTVWFIAVPLGLALFAAKLLASAGSAGVVSSFVREQQVPALIVLFTVFEMGLYSMRHRLPFVAAASSGNEKLSVEMLQQIEAASHLLDEADRVLSKHGKTIDARTKAETRQELLFGLERLRASIAAKPFDEVSFGQTFAAVSEQVDTHLKPWRKSEIREYVESIGAAILVALLLRAVVVEAFKIPSGSMLPTLQIGDHIFVNKFVYGPTVPFTDSRLFSRLPPQRGDVIVFEYPDPDLRRERQDFIKRVMAIPGDVLEVDDGHPTINGWTVPRCLAGHYTFRETVDSGEQSGDLYVEFLSGTSYLALYEDDRIEEKQGPYHVKPGEVWVMGDNRHNSSDSRRWLNGRGAGVPFANIKGRAMFVWLPLERLLVNVMGKPQLPAGASPEILQGIEHCLRTAPALADTFPPPQAATAPAEH
jgi:signal peptidase I